ncbi:RuBisCO large subunit-binding protein subunit beta-2-like protein [Tanacetum coccineum]
MKTARHWSHIFIHFKGIIIRSLELLALSHYDVPTLAAVEEGLVVGGGCTLLRLAAKAIHFLDKLLLYDHQERPTTKEAMIAITRKEIFKSFSDDNRFDN